MLLGNQPDGYFYYHNDDTVIQEGDECSWRVYEGPYSVCKASVGQSATLWSGLFFRRKLHVPVPATPQQWFAFNRSGGYKVCDTEDQAAKQSDAYTEEYFTPSFYGVLKGGSSFSLSRESF